MSQIPVGRQPGVSPFVPKHVELRGSLRDKPLRARALKNGMIRFQRKILQSGEILFEQFFIPHDVVPREEDIPVSVITVLRPDRHAVVCQA